MPIIYGVDISHANPEVSLHELVDAGSLTFIGLKASEGHGYVDPTFYDRFQRLREHMPDTLVLAYHFLRTDSSAADQMAHFKDVLTVAGYFDHPNALAPAIDAERGLQGQEPSRQLTADAIAEFKRITGTLPGLYSGDSYWHDHFVGISCAYSWVARYSTQRPSTRFDIWQDSESRTIAGHAYDHNVAYMTAEQFKAKCGR